MRPHASLVAGALVLASVVVQGCSSSVQPTSPASTNTSLVTSTLATDAALVEPTTLAPGGLLVDLGLGRETRLERVFRARTLAPDGSLLDEIEVHAIVESRLTGTEVHDGRTYVTELVTIAENGGPPEQGFAPPLRQDRSGLFFYQPAVPRGARPTLDAGDAAKAGIAGGLGKSSDKLTEFYLDLARQAGPVVEVGAAKDVVVVIQEGLALEIKPSVGSKF